MTLLEPRPVADAEEAGEILLVQRGISNKNAQRMREQARGRSSSRANRGRGNSNNQNARAAQQRAREQAARQQRSRAQAEAQQRAAQQRSRAQAEAQQRARAQAESQRKAREMAARQKAQADAQKRAREQAEARAKSEAATRSRMSRSGANSPRSASQARAAAEQKAREAAARRTQAAREKDKKDQDARRKDQARAAEQQKKAREQAAARAKAEAAANSARGGRAAMANPGAAEALKEQRKKADEQRKRADEQRKKLAEQSRKPSEKNRKNRESVPSRGAPTASSTAPGGRAAMANPGSLQKRIDSAQLASIRKTRGREAEKRARERREAAQAAVRRGERYRSREKASAAMREINGAGAMSASLMPSRHSRVPAGATPVPTLGTVRPGDPVRHVDGHYRSDPHHHVADNYYSDGFYHYGGQRYEPFALGRRTSDQRRENIRYFSQCLSGHRPEGPAPYQRHLYHDHPDHRFWQGGDYHDAPPHIQYWNRHDHPRHHHHDPYRRRCVRYPSHDYIPAILMAAGGLSMLHINSVSSIPYDQPPVYTPRPVDLPPSYEAPDAYEVSYEVDEDARISMDDILFAKGSTEFADDESYGVVLDLAYAMMEPELLPYRFAVEGHASAEGGYDYNLDLSQRRAERIVREIVGMGVDPERLVPVGFGSSEAFYPATADEHLRAYDRKVVIYKLKD